MKFENLEKWDERFLELAQTVGAWSKEPRKRVGAVIVRDDRTVASMGYNGFPRGIDDKEEWLGDRKFKNHLAVHAETNAIISAKTSVENCTIYISKLYPCSQCAGMIIQSGIKRVVAYCVESSVDWMESAAFSKIMFKEANVEYVCVDDND